MRSFLVEVATPKYRAMCLNPLNHLPTPKIVQDFRKRVKIVIKMLVTIELGRWMKEKFKKIRLWLYNF